MKAGTRRSAHRRTGAIGCGGIVGLVVYIGLAQSAFYGALVRFLFSLGMGVPLVLAAAAMARAVPTKLATGDGRDAARPRRACLDERDRRNSGSGRHPGSEDRPRQDAQVPAPGIIDPRCQRRAGAPGTVGVRPTFHDSGSDIGL